MEFAIGTDIGDAMMRVNTRLQQVKRYPINANEASNTNDRSIARFALTARPPSREMIAEFQTDHPSVSDALETVRTAANPALRVFRLQNVYDKLKDKHPEIGELLPPEVDLEEVRKLSENVIEAHLERVPGVAEADTYGGQEEELQVIVDPERLASRQLTIDDVRTALVGQNKDTSAGNLWEGKRRWVIRTLGQFRDPKQVKRQILATIDGSPVYVEDVAEVARSESRFSQKTSLIRPQY